LWGFNRLACLRGSIGIALRYIFLKNLLKSCGENVAVYHNVTLINIDKIKVGDNVSIHTNCYLDGYGEISIGSNVSVAHNSTILSTNHNWSDLEIPIKYNAITASNTAIEDDVWVGCGVRILAGVVIKSRVVIAAGAVVNKNVGSAGLYGGIPIRFIKKI
jgi:acetyltransferase-like isoleucine patch superfamily enzyme